MEEVEPRVIIIYDRIGKKKRIDSAISSEYVCAELVLRKIVSREQTREEIRDLVRFYCPNEIDLDSLSEYLYGFDRVKAERTLDDMEVGRFRLPRSLSKFFNTVWVGKREKEPDIEKPKFILPDIFYHGYINLSGPWKKSYKTWFCLAASHAINTGGLFLGKRKLDGAPLKVAWIQRDMGLYDFIDYSRKLQKGHKFTEREMAVLTEEIDLLDRRDQQKLMDQIEELGTQVLFIDSARATSSVEEANSDSVRSLTRGFLCDQLRDGMGVSIILICHTAKGGHTTRGSGEWEASADSIVHFRPNFRDDAEEDVEYVSVFCFGRHAASNFGFELEFEEESTRINLVDMEAKKDRTKQFELSLISNIVEREKDINLPKLMAMMNLKGIRVSTEHLRFRMYQVASEVDEISLGNSKSGTSLVYNGGGRG